jgi:uncharacterized cupredoxin-like copper-binding protein
MKLYKAVFALSAVLVLAAGAVACGGGSGDDKGDSDKPQEIKVALTVDGCTPATIKAKTGPTKFVVTNNNAPFVTELELLDNNHVLGEVENVKSGVTRSFTVSLQPGTYDLVCPGGDKTPKGKLTATGKAPPRPTPVPGPTTALKVSMKDYAIVTSLTTAPAGTFNIDVSNSGPATHEFVIIRTDLKADALPVKDGLADEDDKRLTHVDEVEDVEIDAKIAYTVGLTPGHYVFICNISGHYGLGMRTDFTVTGN